MMFIVINIRPRFSSIILLSCIDRSQWAAEGMWSYLPFHPCIDPLFYV